jgi:hypothetical protein
MRVIQGGRKYTSAAMMRAGPRLIRSLGAMAFRLVQRAFSRAFPASPPDPGQPPPTAKAAVLIEPARLAERTCAVSSKRVA